MALPITITDAGRAEIINAENNGTGAVLITEIGFGTGQYTPTAAQTVLQAQIKRVSSIAGQAVADDTIHVMAKDESASAYNVGEFGLFSDKGTLIAVYSQPAASGWIIQKAGPSTLLLATDIILESLNATSLTFGDILFINPPATTTVQGVVELATPEETQTGTDGSRVVTPAGLKSLTGNTTRAGLVQLNNTLTSTSTAQALTAAQGKKLQDEKQPLDATLTALAALVTSANKLIYATGVDTFGLADLTAFARTLLDDADAASARSTLGLGSAAQKAVGDFVSTSDRSTIFHAGAPLLELKRNANTNAVFSIGHLLSTVFVGLSASGELRVSEDPDVSGTGRKLLDAGDATAYTLSLLKQGDAQSARTMLGAQAQDATLTALAAVVTAANQLIYATGADSFTTTDFSAFARTLLDDADATAARATLNAQQQDATLTALAAVATAANKLIYATGADSFATTDLSAFARTLLDDVDAATARATLGAQPQDATLTALAAVATAANKLIYATGVDTFSTADLTAFARTLLDDVDAAAARTTLGLASAAQQPSSAFVSTGAPSTVKHAGAPLISFERDGTTNAVIRIAHATAQLYLGLTTSGELKVGSDPDVNGTGNLLYHAMNLGAAFQRQVGDNGYLKLPDSPGLPGLIIQWGQTAATVGSPNGQNSATFPVAFPNTCFAVVPGTITGSPTGQGSQLMAQLIAKTLTGFTWFSDSFESTGNGTIGVTYIAIGN